MRVSLKMLDASDWPPVTRYYPLIHSAALSSDASLELLLLQFFKNDCFSICNGICLQTVIFKEFNLFALIESFCLSFV